MKPINRIFISFVLIVSWQLSNNSYAQNNSIILDGAYIVLDGGTATNNIFVVVDQPSPSGIERLPSGGHIHSENQYNLVKWLSGTTTGSYSFPFGVGGNSTDYIPFTFNKTAGNSSISTSTWTTNQQNMPHPEATNIGAVTNMNGVTDSVEYAIDRFWDIQATGATADLTFSYRGSENTTSTPTSLIKAQHWNGTNWDTPVGPGIAGVTTGVGTTGPFLAQNTFSPWVLIAPCLGDSVTQNPIICQGESITVGTNTYSTTGVYTDNFTNILGCDSIVTTNLTVNPLPNISSSIINDNCDSNLGQIIIDVNSPNSPFTYNWSNGENGSTISGLSEGSYEVTVTDNSSCSKSKTFSISNNTDNCGCFVYVANAFSPNKDGNNDFIPVHGECVNSLTFKIFNRWGNLVFETNQLNDGWDGYYKGELQNTGVYVYILEATFSNGETTR